MEIWNAIIIRSKSNHFRNLKTLQVESKNITAQLGGINDTKSKVIAFVVNAGKNITFNISPTTIVYISSILMHHVI